MAWREINRQANKPVARAFHTTTLVNGHIYILGGANYQLGVWLYPTEIHYLVPGKFYAMYKLILERYWMLVYTRYFDGR